MESLQSEINELKKATLNSNVKKSGAITTNTDETGSGIENALYQNTPNPFTESSQIGYFLKEITKNAIINIYDMNGTQLKSIELQQPGYGNVIIKGGEFNAGMYMYTLIADGQVVDTKQMILTD